VIGERSLGAKAAVGIVLAASAVALTACGGGDEVAGFDVEGAQDLAKDVSGGADVSASESLFVAANLNPALEDLRGRVGEQAMVDMKIEPASLKLQAQSPGQEAQSVAIGVSGSAFQTAIPGFDVEGPALSEIDPDAIERIARQVSSEADVDLLGIGYFATLPGTQPYTWGVYLDDGRRWEANLDGSGVKRVS
jgi:hypothetical protein